MHYDVIIIGAGVSGTALEYVLAKYTDVESVAIFEKHDEIAQVASHHSQNSQTLHYGDIETNYTYEKAISVSQAAKYVECYITRNKKTDTYLKTHKMVLAIGKEECEELRKRHKKFKKLFPKSKLLKREEIATYEPHVVKGRYIDEEIVAMFSPNGYVMNYHALAKAFHTDAQQAAKKRTFDTYLSTEITDLSYHEDGYAVHTKEEVYTCDQLVVDAGAMSIKLAKMLGYAKHLGILSVAGNFYRTNKKLLNGKVYRMQLAKLPFAAAHGDPDVKHPEITRFGPSAKPLLMLERWNYNTVWPYITSVNYSWDGFVTLLKIATDKTYFTYMIKNLAYDIPYFGSRWFAKNAIEIIPSLKQTDITKDKGYGGARPQIINTKTRTIDMGEARIEAKNAIFNITPSPGASTCLGNARRDTEIMINNFLGKYSFNQKRFEKDLE